MSNDNVFAISGKAASGKSSGFHAINDPEGVMYLNAEHKKLPFRSKFKEFPIADPLQVLEGLAGAENMPEIHTVVIDSLTFLMDAYESVHVITATNTMQAWGEYSQFFKRMMKEYVSASTKNVIFTAHTLDVLNESSGVTETRIPIKGALKNNGIESYFSTVVSAKKVPLIELEDYKNSMLNITPEDEILGYKHCFQTRPTKRTAQDCIRSPMGMWDIQETYIDNNAQHVLDKLKEYYV